MITSLDVILIPALPPFAIFPVIVIPSNVGLSVVLTF